MAAKGNWCPAMRWGWMKAVPPGWFCCPGFCLCCLSDLYVCVHSCVCVCCPWVHSCQVESHSKSSQCWYFLLLIPPPLKCTVPLLRIWRHLFFFFLQTVHIHSLFSLSPTKPVWHHFYCHTGASCDCNYTSYNPVAVCWSLLERR